MLPERQLTFHVDIADVLTLFYRNQLIERYFIQVHKNALKMIELQAMCRNVLPPIKYIKINDK